VLSEEDWTIASAVFPIIQANPTRFDPCAKAGFVLTPSLILRNKEKPAGPVGVISKAELHVLSATAMLQSTLVLVDMLPYKLLDATCKTIAICSLGYHGVRYMRGKGFRLGKVANVAVCVGLVNWGYMRYFKQDVWREKLKQQGSIF